MEDDWVVISYPKSEVEAQIIKGLLESEGIPVFIKQEAYEKAMGMDGLISGIQILVLREHAKEALSLLPK